MNIQAAIDLANEMKPNMMTRETQVRFLSELDRTIHSELVMTHIHTMQESAVPEYDGDTDGSTELIAPERFCMVYVYYLMTKIDLMNMEMDKYNNDRALFESEYGELSDWWTRTKMPIQKTREFRV